MFKGILPHPIHNLFSTNNNRHNYHTRQTMTYKQIQGRGKMFIHINRLNVIIIMFVSIVCKCERLTIYIISKKWVSGGWGGV